MNKNCNGRFFQVNRKHFYQCLWDGEVVRKPEDNVCPNCNRAIDGEDYGKLPLQSRRIQFVVMPWGAEVILPSQEK